MKKYNIQQATELLNKEAEIVTDEMWSLHTILKGLKQKNIDQVKKQGNKRINTKLVVFRNSAKKIVSKTDINLTLPDNAEEIEARELCEKIQQKKENSTKALNNYVKGIFEKEQEADNEEEYTA